VVVLVSTRRRLLDPRRGEGGVSTFGNETVSGAGDFFAFFVGEDGLLDLVVVSEGDGDLPDSVGEGDLFFVRRRGWGINDMTSLIPCFCSEAKEVWTSGDFESCSNSATEYIWARVSIDRISTGRRSRARKLS